MIRRTALPVSSDEEFVGELDWGSKETRGPDCPGWAQNLQCQPNSHRQEILQKNHFNEFEHAVLIWMLRRDRGGGACRSAALFRPITFAITTEVLLQKSGAGRSLGLRSLVPTYFFGRKTALALPLSLVFQNHPLIFWFGNHEKLVECQERLFSKTPSLRPACRNTENCFLKDFFKIYWSTCFSL